MVNEMNYNMGEYLETAEKIAKQKLEMYSDLLRKINWFKQEFPN